MDHKEVSIMFKALGDPTRLRIFQFLRSCCCPVAVGEAGEVSPVNPGPSSLGEGSRGERSDAVKGPTVGEVCCSLTGTEKITSTVSFHLKELRNAGLITMERRGKNMICGVNQQAVATLAEYLKQSNDDGGQCC